MDYYFLEIHNFFQSFFRNNYIKENSTKFFACLGIYDNFYTSIKWEAIIEEN
jgi:hypothetical protein